MPRASASIDVFIIHLRYPTLIAFATSLAEMRMRPWMRLVRIKPAATMRLIVRWDMSQRSATVEIL